MKRPNILFLLADDMGHWAMRNAGNTDIHTPNLDRLARRGVKFDNFFCASPVCSPARASILTGTMPSCHGILDWLDGGSMDRASLSRESLEYMPHETIPIQYTDHLTAYTDILAAGGYRCALSGKWHMGDSMTPQHGFSHWYTIGGGGVRYFNPETIENGVLSEKKGYITDLIGEDALRCLDRFSKEEAPFYLSVHFTAPHSPWEETDHKKEYLLPENSVFFGKTSSDIFLADVGNEAEFICFHFQLFNYQLPFYEVNFIPARNKELIAANKILKYLRMQSDLGMGSANAVFMDLLFSWLRKIRSATTQKTPHYNVIMEAELYINEHIDENLSISGLAKRYNFSEKHFRYLFNRILGLPPKQYIERVKCERAFELLKNTALSVAEIAEKLNFSSPQHLANNLKKIFNLKPSDCRKVKKIVQEE